MVKPEAGTAREGGDKGTRGGESHLVEFVHCRAHCVCPCRQQ